MEDHVSGVIAPAASLLAALGFPSLLLWLVKRAAAREDLVETLRKALDKGRVRENAYCGALDAIVIGIDHLDHPHPALIAARARALQIMENAHCEIRGEK